LFKRKRKKEKAGKNNKIFCKTFHLKMNQSKTVLSRHKKILDDMNENCRRATILAVKVNDLIEDAAESRAQLEYILASLREEEDLDVSRCFNCKMYELERKMFCCSDCGRYAACKKCYDEKYNSNDFVCLMCIQNKFPTY
jgi:hypothetical protein